MLKRFWIYFKEMYPLVPRLFLAFGLFFAIDFLIIANNGVKNFSIGGQEFIAILTTFSFLLALRIADEFKDYESDKKNFPERPLPSGRVKKSDLITLLLIFQIPTIALNLIFMNNLWWFIALYAYGILMTFWFFAKKWIQPNLMLALITHNPVQLLLNFYIISFICTKYGLSILTPNIILIGLALYLPGLTWEISRKIRAPKQETAYTTYSKIMGYKTATLVVVALILTSTIIDTFILWRLYPLAIIVLWTLFAFVLAKSILFIKNPAKSPYIKTTTTFIYLEQMTLLATALIFIWMNRT